VFHIRFAGDSKPPVFSGRIDLLFIPDALWPADLDSIDAHGVTYLATVNEQNGGFSNVEGECAVCWVKMSSFLNPGGDVCTELVAHEIGHGLGLDDQYIEWQIMYGGMDGLAMYLGFAEESYHCVYSQEVVTDCENQDGGASGLASVDVSDSTGVNIVQIRLEEWSDSDSILLEMSPNGYDNFEEIGFELLVDNVATFSTLVDLDQKYLSIICMDDGVVDETFWHYHSNHQPERDDVSMLQSNNEHIENSYWDDIAQGVGEIPLVTDPIPDSEYLIIISDDLTHNWWGTTDTNYIDSHILDGHDNGMPFYVEYLPLAGDPTSNEDVSWGHMKALFR